MISKLTQAVALVPAYAQMLVASVLASVSVSPLLKAMISKRAKAPTLVLA